MSDATKGLLAASVLLISQAVAQQPREQVLKDVLTNPKLADAAPADGRPVFEKVCASCHKFGSIGKEVGPDLSTLTARQKKQDVLESILWPSRAIADQYQMTLIQKRDGTIVAGMVQREDAVRVVVVASDALEAPVTVLKSQIKIRKRASASLMPEDLLNEFTLPQVAGLIAFLFSTPPR